MITNVKPDLKARKRFRDLEYKNILWILCNRVHTRAVFKTCDVGNDDTVGQSTNSYILKTQNKNYYYPKQTNRPNHSLKPKYNELTTKSTKS
ncbi:hypothetical protein BLOT_007396 [Blomia tropicalis]|nr:hypothetical protein BLOT_007396 [Blomia tropicalis]